MNYRTRKADDTIIPKDTMAPTINFNYKITDVPPNLLIVVKIIPTDIRSVYYQLHQMLSVLTSMQHQANISM